ncbi:MAG: hypothetical protein AB1715_11440, partial [Acidobacteriota bacterium]
MRARVILLAVAVLMACQASCKGPYSNETHPVIWVNVYDLSFSASEVGPNPASKVIQIKNAGIQTLSYTLTTASGWIKVTPASGSSSGQANEHVVSIEKDAMVSRTEPYTGKIAISSSQ